MFPGWDLYSGDPAQPAKRKTVQPFFIFENNVSSPVFGLLKMLSGAHLYSQRKKVFRTSNITISTTAVCVRGVFSIFDGRLQDETNESINKVKGQLKTHEHVRLPRYDGGSVFSHKRHGVTL